VLKTYRATKTIQAKPMTFGDYNKHRGKETDKNTGPNTRGFLVRHHDKTETWLDRSSFVNRYEEVEL